MKECTATCPVDTPYIKGTECVTSCSDSVFYYSDDNGKRTCLDECEIWKQDDSVNNARICYLDNTCPTDAQFFDVEKGCVEDCNSYYTFEG